MLEFEIDSGNSCEINFLPSFSKSKYRMTNDASSISDSSKSTKSLTLVPLPQVMDLVEPAPTASSAAAAAAINEPEPESVAHVYQMYISARPTRGTRRVNFASNSSGG